MKITGDSLRDLRYEADLTQVELAQAVGVSERAVRSWETGEKIPAARHRRKLRQVLGVR